MSDPMIQLESLLSTLESGQRAWFWFCPRVEPALRLSVISTDLLGETLGAETAAINLPEDAFPHVGYVHPLENGELCFYGQTLTMGTLEALAAWVVEHITQYPGLARLVGASFWPLDETGAVLMRYAKPDLWGAHTRPRPPGPLAEAEETLKEMATGDTAWIWVSEGVGGQPPQICLSLQEQDPEGEQFQARMKQLARRAAPNGRHLRGVLFRTEDTPLVVTAADAAIVREWMPSASIRLRDHYPTLAQLGEAVLAKTKPDGELDFQSLNQ